jgi:hypothetical protein
MARINNKGRLERRGGRDDNGQRVYYDWFLGKPQLDFKFIRIPEEFWGKRIYFKIGLLDEVRE